MKNVSVVIPAYNAAKFIDRCIKSVLNQTVQPLEVLVIDDGSQDNTADIAQKYSDLICPVTLHHHKGKKNKGVSASRNLGSMLAQGDYVAFLDADDAWHEDKIRKQVEYMNRNPDVGLTHTFVEAMYDKPSTTFKNYSVVQIGIEENWSRGTMLDRLLRQVVTTYPSTFMIKSELAKTHFFMENLPFQNEDAIYVFSVAAITKVRTIKEKLSIYNLHENSHTYDVLRNNYALIINIDYLTRALRVLKKINGYKSRTKYYAVKSISPRVERAWSEVTKNKNYKLTFITTMRFIVFFPIPFLYFFIKRPLAQKYKQLINKLRAYLYSAKFKFSS